MKTPTVRESIEMKLADPNRKAALSRRFHSQRLAQGAGGANIGAMNNLDTVGVDISYQTAFVERTIPSMAPHPAPHMMMPKPRQSTLTCNVA